jgi:hypothetical protein
VPRWGRPPRRGGGGRRAGVAEVGVAAAPRWGSRRVGVGEEAAGRPILGPPRADPNGGRSPPSLGAPSVGRRDERGGGSANPAPSSGLVVWKTAG